MEDKKMALSKEKIDSIKREVETQDRAAADLLKNVSTIWTSQLNMALDAGDEKLVAQLLEQRAELAAQSSRYQDTNCGCE
jgi:DICT domain-containing protein